MKINLVIFLIVAISVLSGCNNSSTDPGEMVPAGQGDNFTFYENSGIVEEIKQGQTEKSDPFEIEKAWIADENGKKMMYIRVIQEQGCMELYPEKFEVIWDGIMLMIYPPQIGFYLAFNSDGCQKLENNVEETITLDLYELFGSKNLVDPAVFTVINVSDPTSEKHHTVERE